MGGAEAQPALPEEVAGRVRETIELAGGLDAAARLTGMSVVQLRRYARGDATPSLMTMGALAQAARVSLDWIYSGSLERGAAPDWQGAAPVIDNVLLAQAMAAVEKAYAQAGRVAELDINESLRRAANLYNRLVGLFESDEQRQAALRFAEAELKDQLSGKG